MLVYFSDLRGEGYLTSPSENGPNFISPEFAVHQVGQGSTRTALMPEFKSTAF